MVSWVWTTTLMGSAEAGMNFGISGGLNYAWGNAVPFFILIPMVMHLRKKMPKCTTFTEFIEQLVLLMETICATGIRVSEVRYITREAAAKGRTQISLKGKLRTILIPGQLCRKLQKYARKKGIGSGELFLTRGGRRLDRRQIWAKMKALCRIAGVAREKVFPHNLRHLFARCFYRASRDISALANMLGHSSIETTRIYLVSTEDVYAKKIARLGLVQQTK